MNYKKYTTNAYNLHIINSDKFKTIMVKINFKKKLKKEDITYRNLLIKILGQSTKNYPSKRDLEIACEDLYNLSMDNRNSISGNYIITSFSSFFLNEKYTEENMNIKSLEFMLDMIFKPNIINNEFAYFDLGKRLVLEEINTLKDDPKTYSTLRLLEEMDKDAYNPVGYIDDLNKIDNNSLYKYYLNLLKSDLIDIFVIGKVDCEVVKQQISEVFKINTLKKPSESHFLEIKKIRKKVKTVKEELSLEQAKLSIGFKLDNLNDFEKKYVMNIYTFILGGSPDSKLFKNVREKNSLCYNISATYRPVSNLMIINAGINLDDFKKCLSLIKKEIIKMSKGDFSDDDINAGIITYINTLKDIEDFEPSLIKIFESLEYLNFDLLEDRAKSIVNVTKEDVINLSKKIHLDTIFVLGGKENGN
ncbi:MAG: insulinase family protein [Bacilli bacterium]